MTVNMAKGMGKAVLRVCDIMRRNIELGKGMKNNVGFISGFKQNGEFSIVCRRSALGVTFSTLLRALLSLYWRALPRYSTVLFSFLFSLFSFLLPLAIFYF